jgi:hypothetical protein
VRVQAVDLYPTVCENKQRTQKRRTARTLESFEENISKTKNSIVLIKEEAWQRMETPRCK